MIFDELQRTLENHEQWARRRQLGIPPNKRLFVLACMDERLPVNEALGIKDGDAHIFRNAGGLVTDDALRSALLSVHFNGTQKIIIINHTDCGMMMTTGQYLIEQLQAKNIDTATAPLNPALPKLQLEDQKNQIAHWLQMFTDVDAVSEKQVELLRNSPFIPREVAIQSYIWEVESNSLRRPYNRLSEKVNTADQMHSATIKACSKCGCLHDVTKDCRCKSS